MIWINLTRLLGHVSNFCWSQEDSQQRVFCILRHSSAMGERPAVRE